MGKTQKMSLRLGISIVNFYLSVINSTKDLENKRLIKDNFLHQFMRRMTNTSVFLHVCFELRIGDLKIVNFCQTPQLLRKQTIPNVIH